MGWTEHVVRMVEEMNACEIRVGKLGRKSYFYTSLFMYNIKVDNREIEH